jgi:hypothetical protein
VAKGELPRIVNEADAALIGLGREIYQRGGHIVRLILQRLEGIGRPQDAGAATDPHDGTGPRRRVGDPGLVHSAFDSCRAYAIEAHSGCGPDSGIRLVELRRTRWRNLKLRTSRTAHPAPPATWSIMSGVGDLASMITTAGQGIGLNLAEDFAAGVRAAARQIRGEFFWWSERAMDCNVACSLIGALAVRAHWQRFIPGLLPVYGMVMA